MPIILKQYSNQRYFKETFFPLLLEREAQHCVPIGIINTLIDTPEQYPVFYLFGILDQATSKPLGAAWLTPPFPLGVTDLSPEAADELVKRLVDMGLKPSGIVGSSEGADTVCMRWLSKTGCKIASKVDQRIFEIRHVDPRFITESGSFRVCDQGDYDLLLEWGKGFSTDCGLVETDEMIEGYAKAAIKLKNRYVWVASGNIVSMAALIGDTPNGIRVGYVYTPPEFRKRGYASYLVAQISEMRLKSDKKFCFLYTDLANPTSNKIYQEIGYKAVCDSTFYQLQYK